MMGGNATRFILAEVNPPLLEKSDGLPGSITPQVGFRQPKTKEC